MKRRALPRSLAELRGLRAARWYRESTRDQLGAFGPDSQRQQQTRAIESYGLVDTGVEWTVAHSGRTITRHPAWAEMLSRAGVDYDVLVVGYVSRFARSVEAHVDARRQMHAAGATILFADDRVLTSDEEEWERWIREVAEAESYSRRLARRVRQGLESRFHMHRDQWGRAPLGFRRTGGRPSTLVIDHDVMPRVVALFEQYAAGNVSHAELADRHGMIEQAVREILRNPVYNGWVRRGRRSAEEVRIEAPWRQSPPVSDELFERVQRALSARTFGGGPRRPNDVDPLAGLVYCECGRYLSLDGRSGNGSQRRRHLQPCDSWGDKVRRQQRWFVEPIEQQIAGIRLDERTIRRITAALSKPARLPDDLGRARIERQLRELAGDVAAGRLSDELYLVRARELREQLAELKADDGRRVSVPADRAEHYLRTIADAWERASDPHVRSRVIHAVYARIEIRGRDFAGVTLTPEAYAHGLALALPERVAMARRTGLRHALPTRSVPIVGRREWAAAAREGAA